MFVTRKIDLVFHIVLRSHFQFQQTLSKSYIGCNGVYVTFLQKESVYVMKRAILALK